VNSNLMCVTKSLSDNDYKLTGNVGKRGRETDQISRANFC
jgi:hypothetical protein